MKTWFDLYASERTRRVPRPTRAAGVLTLAATFGFILSGPVRHLVDRRELPRWSTPWLHWVQSTYWLGQ